MTLSIRLHETIAKPEYTVPTGDVVRLPVQGLTERAMGCEVAQSEIVFDDPGGVFTLDDMAAFRLFRLEESACTNKSIFTGNFLERVTARGSPPRVSLMTGTDRAWTVRCADFNWQMYRRNIHGSDGVRPAETDVERIDWLIASAYTFNTQDVGLIDRTNPVDMGAVDYRGRFAIDVINDCMKVSGKNAFVTPDQSGGDLDTVSIAGFAYFVATDATFSSSISISNDPADSPWMPEGGTFADVVAVDPAVQLTSDPERLFPGGSIRYTGGFVYGLNPTAQAIYGTRDFSVDEPDIKTADAANALLAKYLDVSSFEEDIIVANVVLPAAQVNNILAGHRIAVKFIHLPGYEDFVWRRIAQRSVSQWNNRRDLYQLTLELRDPRLIGGIGTGAIPVPAGTTNGGLPYQPSPDTSTISVQIDVAVAMTADGSGCPSQGAANFVVSLTDSFSGTPVFVGDSPYTAGGSWIGIATTGNLTDAAATLRIHTTGNHFLMAPVDLPLNTPIYVWGEYDNSGCGTAYTNGTTTVDWDTIGFTPPAGVTIVVTPGSVSSGPSGSTFRLCSFVLSTGGTTTPPVFGQPVLGETPTPTPDGSTTTFTTAHPFVAGSLKVFVDNVDQTGAISSQDAAAGTFTLAFAPKVGEQVTVNYQAG